MTQSTHKKWFVYMGDHHEGPFTQGEIEAKFEQKIVTPQHYFWCEGMQDWLLMTEIPELAPVYSPRSVEPPEPAVNFESMPHSVAVMETEPTYSKNLANDPGPQTEQEDQSTRLLDSFAQEAQPVQLDQEAAAPSASEAVEPLQPMSVAEANEPLEPMEVAEADEPLEPMEVAEAGEPLEPMEVAEADEPLEPMEVAEAGEPLEPMEVAEAGEPLEPMEVAEAGEPLEPMEVAEAGEPLEPMEVAEADEPLEPTQTLQTQEQTAAALEPVSVPEKASEKSQKELDRKAAKDQKKREKEEKRAAKKAEKEEKKRQKEAEKEASRALKRSRKGKNRTLRWLSLILMVLVVVAGIQFKIFDPLLSHPQVQPHVRKVMDWVHPILLELTEQAPVLQKWISPLPIIDGISPQEYERLKKVALMGLKSAGPQVALAVANAASGSPIIHFASNLPDGVQFDVYIKGQDHTLLNQFGVMTKSRVLLKRRLASSRPIQLVGGAQIPIGQYDIHVVESAIQDSNSKKFLSKLPMSQVQIPAFIPKEKKIYFKFSQFMGGERDRTYQIRLQKFQLKMKEKAQAELIELRQVYDTLMNQLSETYAQFTRLKKGKVTRSKRRQWDRFHQKWNKIYQQLSQSFKNWSDDTIQTDFFYGNLYSMTKAAAASLLKLHEMHASYFKEGSSQTSFDVEHGQAVSQTNQVFGELGARLKKIEESPLTEHGIPRSDGL